MKIVVVSILMVISLQITYAQVSMNKVEVALNSLVKDPELAAAAISFQAIDLKNGEVIAAHQPLLSIPTASIMKLFTTALALETLGPFHQPKTSIYIDGAIDSTGVLHGNIWIKGGGDPSLGSKFFYNEDEQRSFLLAWVDSIRAKGIQQINGRVIADGSQFGYKGAPEGWMWGDMGNYYGAGPAGCLLFDNLTHLYFETSKNLNDTTYISCVEPYISRLNIRNEVKTSKSQSDNAYVYGAPFSYDRLVTGSLPANKEEFKVRASIPDPELLLAQEFQFELAQHITLTEQPIGYRSLSYSQPWVKSDYSTKKLLFSHTGKTIENIAYWTNMRSVNLYAEQLLCLVGHHKTGSGTTESGAAYAQNYWKKLVGDGFAISDGSGLSRKNAGSASDFCSLLTHMHSSLMSQHFKKTLPVAGKSGTLSAICRGQAASGRIAAKSGTMNRIKAYSGYVESTTGKEMAFAIIVNNHTCSNLELIKKIEKIFNAMATY